MINPYWELVILLCMINAIFAVSLNLIVGYNGQFSLGHAGFIAIGAYTSGVLTSVLGWPLWAAMLAAMVFSAVAAVVIGYPCLRLRGDYLAIATLGFAEIIRIALLALPAGIFGGPTGMRNVASFADYISTPRALNGAINLAFTVLFAVLLLTSLGWGLWALGGFVEAGVRKRLGVKHMRWAVIAAALLLLGWQWRPAAVWLLSTFQFSSAFSAASYDSDQWALFLLFLAILAAILWIVRNYLNSATGRAVIAIREDEVAATNLGVNCTWLKLQNFTFGCALAGLGGAMLAHTLPLFKPQDFNFFKSVDVLLMVVLGGMGSLTGSIVGGVSITLLPEVLRFIGRWRMVIYSLLLVLLMIFRPTGLLGTAEVGDLFRRRWTRPPQRPAQGPGGPGLAAEARDA